MKAQKKVFAKHALDEHVMAAGTHWHVKVFGRAADVHDDRKLCFAVFHGAKTKSSPAEMVLQQELSVLRQVVANMVRRERERETREASEARKAASQRSLGMASLERLIEQLGVSQDDPTDVSFSP